MRAEETRYEWRVRGLIWKEISHSAHMHFNFNKSCKLALWENGQHPTLCSCPVYEHQHQPFSRDLAPLGLVPTISPNWIVVKSRLISGSLDSRKTLEIRFLQSSSKPHGEVAWNAIQFRFVQMVLPSRRVFCVTSCILKPALSVKMGRYTAAEPEKYPMTHSKNLHATSHHQIFQGRHAPTLTALCLAQISRCTVKPAMVAALSLVWRSLSHCKNSFSRE